MKNNADFSVYPNPAENDFTIVFQQATSAGTISISDINSRVIDQFQFINGAQTMKINSINYPNGIYLVQYINQNNTLTKKLIVSH